MEGLEPTRLAALDPKSSASANSATSAKMFWTVIIVLLLSKKISIMSIKSIYITFNTLYKF